VAARSVVHSRANSKLIERASQFLSNHVQNSEVLLIATTRAAAHELAISVLPQGSQGIHAMTLIQIAATLASQPMGRASLAPISRLGMEAIAARIVHSANRAEKLKYFGPVAETPGFPRAVARSIIELRLEGIRSEDLAATGAPGTDLALLMSMYAGELEQRSLADLPMLLKLAVEEGSQNKHRLTGLPLLLLDLTVQSQSHEKLLSSLVEQSPSVLATAITGDEPALQSLLSASPENLDGQAPEATLDRVRYWLFSPQQPPPAPPDPDLLFSAPGENLECVEIARRIRALAEQGVNFDRVAILLRNVEQYQPLVEEALRRAAIPAYFSRGVARPDPAGRAFLALLACAGEGCSATRFAEYLSLGQLPPVDKHGAPVKQPLQWTPPDDEILANFPAPPLGLEIDKPDVASESTLSVPIGWEKLLVDAAVIGGHDRWARRLRGLRRAIEDQVLHDELHEL
jgi:ATP-dependent helicase/nuclease subunit B